MRGGSAEITGPSQRTADSREQKGRESNAAVLRKCLKLVVECNSSKSNIRKIDIYIMCVKPLITDLLSIC